MNSQKGFGENDDILPEYDFSQGVRGKHYKAYQAGTNVVFLDPDVAKVFTDSASVNQALRRLLRLTENAVPTKGRPNKAPQATSRRRPKGKPHYVQAISAAAELQPTSRRQRKGKKPVRAKARRG
jgi:hypothetical protein